MKRGIVGIYKITSPSGSVYIGQSRDIKIRLRQHNSKSERNHYLRNSVNKYGILNHKMEVISELPIDVSQDVLNAYEILYISSYKNTNVTVMNLREGGDSGGKMTKEAIEKSSAAKRGKPMHPITREAIRKANIGRPMSQKVKQIFDSCRTVENAVRMGKMNIGKTRTQDNKDRISQTLKKRLDNKGELHNMAKLNKNQVLEIRSKYIPRVYSSRKIALEYNLSKTNVLDIVNRKIWNNI